ncbi:MAG: STAS domain-containing protein [Chloroflexi bacterium]|nr:STAS domain-containing protein [Chloroflexota bacterium]MBP8057142.1 STAS domain-containing protein [Chloroflexota bacterium]
MSIQHTISANDVILVEVSGRLDQDQAPLLEVELTQLLQEAQYQIIVNLAEVNYINSAGLRCLVGAWRKTKEHGGHLYLAGLNARLNEVFSMVGFDKVFQIFPSTEAAQEALTQAG